MNKPNIIYLHSHDTGRYIQPYGYPVTTPNLQKLAEQGVLFRNAHCANPTCSPSRACLLTGQHAHQNGMMGLSHRGFGLNDPKKHLVHTLRNTGYETVLGGLQHLVSKSDPKAVAREIGYERFLPHADNYAASVAGAVIPFLKEKQEKPDRPFFLSAGMFETHRVFPPASPAHEARYMRGPSILPDTPQVREDWANYCTMASQLDEAYGRILGQLRASGLDENTIVVCTTDHGIAFPGMKCNLTDHGTGVLLIIRGPGFEGGKVIDPLVSHLDIYPTLCEAIGVDKPSWLVGKSLQPVVAGQVDALHDELVTTVNVHAAVEPMRCVRTTRYSYIRRYEDRPKRILSNCDAGPSKSVMLQAGWGDQAEPAEQLFDLALDPQERCNVIDQSTMTKVLDDMRSRLARWQKQTGDPLLDGPLHLPAGARVNAWDEVNPS